MTILTDEQKKFLTEPDPVPPQGPPNEFVDANTAQGIASDPSTSVDQPTPSPTMGETIGAAFRQENVLAQLPSLMFRDERINPDFNPLDDLSKIDLNYIEDYMYAKSPEEVERINQQIQQEQRDRQTLASSGITGMAAVMAASILDPAMLIPATAGFKAIKGVTATARLARTAVGAVSGAAIGAGIVGTQEAILGKAEITRPEDAMRKNMLFASAVGGILGGAIGAVQKGVVQGAAEELKAASGVSDVKVDITDLHNPQVVMADSAGAAKVSVEQLKMNEGLAYVNYKVLESLVANMDPQSAAYKSLTQKMKYQEKVFGFVGGPVEAMRSPFIRGITSEFPAVKSLTQNLFESPLITMNDVQGIARQSFENSLRTHHAVAGQLQSSLQQAYIKYAGIKTGKGIIGQIEGKLKSVQDSNILSFTKFREEVGKAVRSETPHAIPEVNDLVARYRAHYSNMLKQAQDVGLLKDVPDNPHYLTQVWDRSAIVNRRAEFENLIERNVKAGTINPAYVKYKEALAKGEKAAIEAIPDKWLHEPITDAVAAQEATQKIVDNLLGQGDGALSWSSAAKKAAVSSSKSLKERKLFLNPDEAAPFLVNDIDYLTASYTHHMSSVVEMKKMMARNGWDSVNSIKQDMKFQLDALIKEHPEKAVYLNKRFNKDLKLVDDMMEIAMGTLVKDSHTFSAESLKVLRKMNLLSRLGYVAISSFPDLAMPIFKHGLGQTMRHGWFPWLRGFKSALAQGDELAKHFALALDVNQNYILKALQDGSTDVGLAHGMLDRLGNDVVQTFGKVTLLNYWNVMGKRIAALTSGGRTMELIEQWIKKGNIPLAEKTRLASLGIDQDIAKRIYDQFFVRGYGKKVSGSYISNFHLWRDLEAAKRFGLSMVNDADHTIVTPGMGDIPVFMQKSHVAKSVMQFKTFSAAATHQVLLAGLQRKDAAALQGFLSLIGMGATVYAIRQSMAGKDVNLSPLRLINEGISRSGVNSLFFDYVLALNPYTTSSRWAAYSTASRLFGPSADTISSLYSDVVYPAAHLNFQDIKTSKFLPYSNLFYFKILMDRAFPEGNSGGRSNR